MACLNLLESDTKPKLKVLVYVGLTFCLFFFFLHSFGPAFWLLIGDTFLLLTATPGFAQTFTWPMYICVRARACVCARVCVRVLAFICYCQMSKPTTYLRSCYILWFPLVEPFFLITFLQYIIFLVFVCLLLMDFFFGQVCLRLAWEVQYLVDRFGIHQTIVCFSSLYFSFTSVLSLFLPKAQLTFYFPLQPFRSPFAQPYFTDFLFILKSSCKRSLGSLIEPGAIC